LLFVVLVQTVRQELLLFALTKDAVRRVQVVNLFTAAERFAIILIDNLIVAYNTDSKATPPLLPFLITPEDLNGLRHPRKLPIPRRGGRGARGGGGAAPEECTLNLSFE
jgi:hypothetical protein